METKTRTNAQASPGIVDIYWGVRKGVIVVDISVP